MQRRELENVSSTNPVGIWLGRKKGVKAQNKSKKCEVATEQNKIVNDSQVRVLILCDEKPFVAYSCQCDTMPS